MIRIWAIDPFSQWDSGSPDLDGSYVIDENGMELSLVREIMSRSASAYMITRYTLHPQVHSYFHHISNTPPFVPVPPVSPFVPMFPVSLISISMPL